MEQSHLNNLLEECPKVELITSHIVSPKDSRRYYLGKLWALNIYDHSMEVVLNGESQKVKRGHICLMPPGTVREFIFTERSLHRVAHFHLPGGRAYKHSLALLFDSGEKCEYFISRFDKALKCHSINRWRAVAILWDLLWELVELPDIKHTWEPLSIHPELSKAIAMIETNFSERLKVKDIIASVELSHNQLNHLFHVHCGCSIIAYIRGRRAHMAKHLLQNTNMRIKEIAGEIGMSDLQQFNKFIRGFFGRSPRSLRESAL